MENLKTFDGLPLNTEDALSNMEKLIGAALVYDGTVQKKSMYSMLLIMFTTTCRPYS